MVSRSVDSSFEPMTSDSFGCHTCKENGDTVKMDGGSEESALIDMDGVSSLASSTSSRLSDTPGCLDCGTIVGGPGGT